MYGNSIPEGLIVRRFKDRLHCRMFEGTLLTRHNLDAFVEYYGGAIDGSYMRGQTPEYRVRYHVEGGPYWLRQGQWLLRRMYRSSDEIMAIDEETLAKNFEPDLMNDRILRKEIMEKSWTFTGQEIFDAMDTISTEGLGDTAEDALESLVKEALKKERKE